MAIEVVHADALEWMLRQDPRRWALLLIDPPYGVSHSTGSLPRAKFEGVEIEGDKNTEARDRALAWWGTRPAAVFGSWKVAPWGDPVGALYWDKGGQSGGGDLDFPWWQCVELIHLYGEWSRAGADKLSPIISVPPPFYSDGFKLHPHQKPVALLEQILDRAPAGDVLDLFAGSGSTAIVADRCGRNVTVVEVAERWWPAIDHRIATETRQRPLFAEARS